MSALTIIDLRRSGRGLVAACNECGHRSTLMATNPKLPPDLEVVEARTKLACSACGSRDIQTYPQSWRSIRMAEHDLRCAGKEGVKVRPSTARSGF
jgi:DNA-directed RNA polymerase subunit RPC12/RpoP